ncbi:MAG: ImmA/IrrE family metallo-endopeptidase [Nitrososphaera sp.]
MNRAQIEQEARRLQFEIWSKREFLFPLGVPPLLAMFQPGIAAHVLDLAYEDREYISAGSGQVGYGVAGILDRQRGIIYISSQFKPVVQRFTGAHEIGHFQLHSSSKNHIFHRDLPILEMRTAGRPPIEQEADYFAACYLAPSKLVIDEFSKRFGTPPLQLDYKVAFHLCGNSSTDLFIDPPGSLASLRKFAAAVAGAQKFGGYPFPSLAMHFGMSISAMAIRLQELGLVRD